MNTMQSVTPVLEYHREDTTFSVYRAKQLYSDAWENSELRSLVGRARESYRIYSPTIPNFDSYDAKSAVYIVCARYPVTFSDQSTIVQEWVTVRFVPADAQPLLSEDLKQYVLSKRYGGQPVLSSMCERLLATSPEQAQKQVVTFSRFCANRPQAEHESEQWIVNAYWEAAGMRTKNRWTALAFALLSNAFLVDESQRYKSDPLVFTAQIQQKVEELVFQPAIRVANGSAVTMFPYAHSVLQLADPSDICLNRREYAQYFYRFPGYFFAVSELIAALTELVDQGKLSAELLQQYIDVSWEQLTKHPHYSHLQRLGELLSTSESLPGSEYSGSQLREFLDQRVSDGVQLRLLLREDLQQRCEMLMTVPQTKKEQT